VIQVRFLLEIQFIQILFADFNAIPAMFRAGVNIASGTRSTCQFDQLQAAMTVLPTDVSFPCNKEIPWLRSSPHAPANTA
jgi:hypothetical protein